MPALPSPGKVIRTRLQFTDGTDTNILNTLHFSYTGTVSSADLTSFNTTLGTDWGSYMKAYITENVTLESITSTDLSSDLGAEVETAIGTTGTNSGTKMPSSVCMVIKLEIARRYRGGHPRNYLTGFPTSYLATADTWSTTEANDIVSSYGTMISALLADAPADAGTVGCVNVSYYNGFTAVENPLTHRYRNVPTVRETPVVDNVNSFGVNYKVAAQRRRNQQRG